MESSGRIELRKPKGRRCFACGLANPIGLKLSFYVEGDMVKSDLTIGPLYEGWGNMVHGGIISTLIDETMSWAVMYFKKVLFVTRKMELKYIRPVPTNLPLRASASIVSEEKGPLIRARAEIRDLSGGLLVRGSGEFVAMAPEKLTNVPEDEKEEMLELLNSFG